MRGADPLTESLFSISQLNGFVPAEHPLRPIRKPVNQALERMDSLFQGMYADELKGAHPSIATKCFTACAQSACSWSKSTTTCYFNGLVVNARVTTVDRYCEHEAAKAMLWPILCKRTAPLVVRDVASLRAHRSADAQVVRRQ